MEKKFESVHSKILARQRLQTRLQDLFMTLNISASSPLFTEKLSQEKKESLILTFNHGIDPDPAFSGSVLGKLYLDEEKNFCLALWPIDAKKEKALPWRKEILFSHIEDFRFEFLGEKIKANDPVLAASQKSSYVWHTEWESSRNAIPSQIRLTLSTQDQTLIQFAFFPMTPSPTITYWEGAPL